MATFTNTSAIDVKHPFFEVTEPSEGAALTNSDSGVAGVGATVSPDVGDGTLSPGESVRGEFRIRLRGADPFRFRVALRGEPVF
jgi:hypothetical protein